MAAAVLLAGALATFAVGSAEAAGIATGRTTIDVTDLPFGPTKSEHVAMLREAAVSHDVDLALLAPDRTGEASAFDLYVLSGAFEPPTFWARSAQHTESEVGDAVITWTYAVDGDPADVAAFLEVLRAEGFAHAVLSLTALDVLLGAASSPGIAGGVCALFGGLIIALVAESRRRRPRTRARLLSGWTHRQIARREACDVGALIAACALPMVLGLFLFVVSRGAAPAVVDLLIVTTAVLVAGVAGVVTTAHIAFVLLPQRLAAPTGRSVPRGAIVATVGVVLVVLVTSTGHALVEQGQRSRDLERALADEAADGDDVTLGIGFADERDDLALGSVGAEAIANGTARMAMTNFTSDALLIADVPSGGSPRTSTRGSADGATVLVPERLSYDTTRIRAAVREAFDDAWTVDDTEPVRAVPIDVQPVGSTAPMVRAAERWVDWGMPRSDPSDDIPVVIVHSIADLAPNRVGTAVHNGEVRFTDRDALTTKLRATGTIDVVTQINRVGATIERQLTAIRTERSVAIGGAILGVLSILLAAVQLVGDHLRRSETARRVRELSGVHPVRSHAPFVLISAAVAGAAVLVAALGRTGPVGATDALLASAAAGGVAVLLTAVLFLTSRHGKVDR